jgi:hypothetical protein
MVDEAPEGPALMMTQEEHDAAMEQYRLDLAAYNAQPRVRMDAIMELLRHPGISVDDRLRSLHRAVLDLAQIAYEHAPDNTLEKPVEPLLSDPSPPPV